MDRQRIAFGAMWATALAAMGVIYVTQERGRDPRARSGDDARILTPDADRAPPAAGAPDGRPAAATQPASRRPPPPGAPRQFRGDARHTANSSLAGPTDGAEVWSVETGGHVSGQPVVGPDGTVYFGSHDHHLYAVDPTGRVLFRRDLGGEVYSTPALVEGRLFVGSDADFFFCLDARSGEVQWHLRTDDDADTGVAVAPDGTLVFGAGRDVFAVTPQGQVRWRFRTGLKVFSTPAIDDDGTIYFGSQDDHLYALAPDGRMRWRFQARDDVDGSPTIGDDGTIYFGSDDHHVYALRPDGTTLWSTDVDGDVRAPLALGRDGSVLAGVFAPRPRLVALDPGTGSERWDFAVTASDSAASVTSGPLVDRDGRIYFGADDDFVYALEPGGRMRWFVRTGGNVDGEPVLAADGLLLVGSDDHRLHAIGTGPPPSH